MKNIVHLMSALEIEEALGSKYFYRQRIYRMAEAGTITTFERQGKSVYLGNLVLKAFLKDLEEKIATKFPDFKDQKLQVFYDQFDKRRIYVDGLFGKTIYADTDKENEDDILKKISNIVEFMLADTKSTSIEGDTDLIPTQNDKGDLVVDLGESNSQELAGKPEGGTVLPEEIAWVKVPGDIVDGVPVKSGMLVSLASIAQFVGIRTDYVLEWITATTLSSYVLSAHYKQVQTPEISGVWKKGVVSGKTPYIPFELLPEMLVAFKQSGRTVNYPQKAEMLYEIAKTTLEAVGLAVIGNRDQASQELAAVGRKLGLTMADQIIGIFKQYESREFQISSTKEFASQVKKNGEEYALTTGRLTLGITERTASWWKAYGASRNLPKSMSGREVMRNLSPTNSIGMVFGEQHYIKEPKIDEAIETGRQGKNLYGRLNRLGLLDKKEDVKNIDT